MTPDEDDRILRDLLATGAVLTATMWIVSFTIGWVARGWGL